MSKKTYFIVSDLHLEFRQGTENQYWRDFPNHDSKNRVCLCAGDVTSFGLPDTIIYKHFQALIERFEKVIYVPGNHEYYGSSPQEVSSRLGGMAAYFGPALTVLRTGEPYTYDGQRFIGDTMWFPDRPEVHIYRRQINDSFQIKDLFPWCFTESSLFLNYLRANMQADDIIITHHVPNDIDTSPRWKGNTTEAYFLNKNCERMLQDPNTVMPKAWIYGHTHDKHDYMIGSTHFICNPIGYGGENTDLQSRQFLYEL
jgi:predicted phosphodiesterase